MTRPPLIRFIVNDFDEFLFAPVGTDGNGHMVSVLSMLARQNIDPWQEAAALADCPDAAANRLAGLILAPPEWAGAPLDAAAVAAKLIALLPRQRRLEPSAGKTPAMTTAGISNSVFVFVLLVGLAIACETLLAGRQTDKTATDGGSDRGGPTDSSRQ